MGREENEIMRNEIKHGSWEDFVPAVQKQLLSFLPRNSIQSVWQVTTQPSLDLLSGSLLFFQYRFNAVSLSRNPPRVISAYVPDDHGIHLQHSVYLEINWVSHIFFSKVFMFISSPCAAAGTLQFPSSSWDTAISPLQDNKQFSFIQTAPRLQETHVSLHTFPRAISLSAWGVIYRRWIRRWIIKTLTLWCQRQLEGLMFSIKLL